MKLFNHQVDAARFAIENGGNVAIWHEMGLGKTRTAIEIFSYYRTQDPDVRMLVICPISLLEGAWGQDINRFSNFKYHNSHEWGIPQGQVAPSITLINFEGLRSEARAKDLIDLIQKSKVNWLCVIDESSRMKSHSTETTKTLLKRFRGLFKYKLVMSGTPAPNSEMEYWGQMEFIRPGIFSNSFFKFRNTFFHLQRGKQILPTIGFMSKTGIADVFSKGFKYEITDANRQKLMATIRKYSHFAKKKDCLDLPDQVDEERVVELGPKQKRAYREMKTQLLTEIGGEDITAPVALAKLMKLREITSGFAIGESGSPVAIGEEPKVKEMMDTIEEAGTQQIIIWANFHWEILRICHELRSLFKKVDPVTGKMVIDQEEADRQIVTLYGGTADRDGSITAFQDGRARFLVAHPRSAAHGLTFVGCSLQIFFSLDYSSESYEQARARTHRAGQKNVCTYVHLIAKDTIDGDILDILRKKKTAADVILKFKS